MRIKISKPLMQVIGRIFFYQRFPYTKISTSLFIYLSIILIPEPTARSAVRRGLLIPLGYLHPGKCEHSEVQSHPPCHGRTTFFVVMRMRESSQIFKNMADYMKSEHWLKASEKAKTKTRTTATRLQETPEKR